VLIVDLPVIPRVLVLPRRVFRRVVLAWFIHCAGRPRGLENSQRQICSRFNRSNRQIIGNYLKEARDDNFLRLLTPSDGLNPDVHVRGVFFDNRTRDGDRLIQLANSLWGSRTGLLSQWPYPTAWGHGCITPAAVLCLATLNVLDEPIPRKTLRKYLEPLVPESSFSDAIRWMRAHQLLIEDASGLRIANDWTKKFVQLLVVNPAGTLRQVKGDLRRRRETDTHRTYFLKETITQKERKELRELPCVWKNCQRKGTEMEHFPPRRFLRHLADQTNKHLVWSICEEHNDQTNGFIKRIEQIPHSKPGQLQVDARYCKKVLYDIVSNIRIQQYYLAYERGDLETAAYVIQMALSLWTTIENGAPQHNTSVIRGQKGNREMRGGSHHYPSLSKL
jgi:hypothetical protein